MKLIDQLKYHPDNQPVFEYLEIDLIKGKFSIQPGDQINGYDAGGVIFFREYTKNIPDEAKYILNGYHNLLVNEETGQIIAFHVGRFTFIFRCDFERNKIDRFDLNSKGLHISSNTTSGIISKTKDGESGGWYCEYIELTLNEMVYRVDIQTWLAKDRLSVPFSIDTTSLLQNNEDDDN